jgi:inositol hexakisphosphate/diphosphoinositol-pentakisphosphate kinase
MTQLLVVGICAMSKKARSAPMTQLLDRLRGDEFEVIVFDEAQILDRPVEEWPECDALLAFYSNGFPLHKARAYAEIRKPFLFNDLAAQELLLDRAMVYTTLMAAGVPVPAHVVLHGGSNSAVSETAELICIDGVEIRRPFVEKPLSSEDHSVIIYYAQADGGGAAHLFRKSPDDACSRLEPEACATRAHGGGSYIYEEWLPTAQTDIKVYTAGGDHAYAEQRRAPAADRKVERDESGRERRQRTVLTDFERDIAARVHDAFGQAVCGFDLLRTVDGRSCVCDVNGWSFVKQAPDIWDAIAERLRATALRALRAEASAELLSGANTRESRLELLA